MPNSILDHYVAKANQNFQPLFSTIEIIHRCNFVCKHCYNFDRNTKKESPINNPLNDEEVFISIEQLAKAGALYLNFTGGEPLLHPSINLFIKKAKKEHFFVRLKTNASLLNEQKSKKLYNNGLDAIDISLYGSSNQSYKKFTNRSSFDETIQGIHSAVKNNIDVYISIILHRYNINELDEMVQLCKSNQWKYQISDEITDRYDQTSAQKSLGITDSQFKSLLEGPYKEIFECDNKEKNLQCSCAKTVCAISLNGDVYPCIGAPIKSGNIREKDFLTIWEQSKILNNIRNLQTSDFKDCSSCHYIENCSRSSGSAYVNTGKYTGCDPFALDRAKIRSQLKS